MENENYLDIDGKFHYYSLYGIQINLSDGIKEYIKQYNADHKAEVLVTYKDQSKEFTLDEFLNILGFKKE